MIKLLEKILPNAAAFKLLQALFGTACSGRQPERVWERTAEVPGNPSELCS